MKVFIDKEFSPLLNDAPSHAMPFAFDQRWRFTSAPQEADIVPLLHLYGEEFTEQLEYFQTKFSPETRVVLLHVFHDAEDSDPRRFANYQEFYSNITILSTAYNSPWEGVLFYDFLWNRTKGLYGLGYFDKRPAVKSPWIRQFDLNIFERNLGTKNIITNVLIPNRAYYDKFLSPGHRLERRAELHKLEFKNTLMSNPDKDIIFVTDNWRSTYAAEIKKGGVYAPIANHYYNETFVSAYVESVVRSDSNFVSTITEKTWEPLLKGHFIIPFATPGIVDELARRGFKFPHFIDYTYTREQDDNVRWKGFINQVKKISNLSLDQVNTLYNDNKHIIEYNKILFQTLPYDSLYDKLK